MVDVLLDGEYYGGIYKLRITVSSNSVLSVVCMRIVVVFGLMGG